MFRPKMSFNSKLLHRVFSMTKTMNQKITWCVVAICNCLEMMCYSTRIFCDWISSGFVFCVSIVWHIDEMASRTENIFKNLSMENKPRRPSFRTECTPMGWKNILPRLFSYFYRSRIFTWSQRKAPQFVPSCSVDIWFWSLIFDRNDFVHPSCVHGWWCVSLRICIPFNNW